ncbi:UvrD-helicase domain-containing protein [Streptococcus suis]|uniref:UvrD-helicase domain-containing protein n=1 Tax=Streptococcus suis TaxID=1307 RepID=UPI002FC848CD
MSDIAMQDKKVKKELLEYQGNILILANAGSGKTTFLAEKLKNDSNRLGNYQKLAAITFTRNATEEIKQKLVDIPENVTVSTIDSFLDKEIILPFLDQRYELATSLQFSFQQEYKFNNFDIGLSQIMQKGIFATYDNPTAQQGKNFKCEVVLDILINTKSASEYLKYKFNSLYIDEFQDCDQSMNDLFMYLKDELGIRLFIVGDDKQSIYQWRGASPRYIKNLWENDNDFRKERFIGNFRSLPKIVDFSLALTPEVTIDSINEIGSILYIETKQYALKEDVIRSLVENGDINLDEKNYFLIGNNQHIEETATQLGGIFPNKFDYVRKNPFIECINGSFLQSLAQYYFLDDFSEYNVLNNLVPEYNDEFRKELLKKLKRLSQQPTQLLIEEIASYLGVSITVYEGRLESQILLDVLSNLDNKKLFDMNLMNNNLLMTTHASKGLAADTVVIFVEYLVDWRTRLKFEDHYVAITRAKSKVIIIDNKTNYVREINRLLCNNNANFSFDDFVERRNL